MIRRCLLLLQACCVLASVAEAQKMSASTNASSLGEVKGATTVDYATGTFNYHLPLFSHQVNGAEVKVGMGYSASGIKVEQVPGTLGFGWAITGLGVINRTVRGGIPDDYPAKGLLEHPLPSDPTARAAYQLEINSRKKDGETDIFSLSYPGLQADFFLEKVNGEVKAVTLKQSDLEIAVEMHGLFITGFTVTDTKGNRYFFRDMETIYAYHQRLPSSFADQFLREIGSSWFLSSITMYNGEEVHFDYIDDLVSEMTQTFSEGMDRYGLWMREIGKDPQLISQITAELKALETLGPEYANVALQFSHQLEKMELRFESLASELEFAGLLDNFEMQYDTKGHIGQLLESANLIGLGDRYRASRRDIISNILFLENTTHTMQAIYAQHMETLTQLYEQLFSTATEIKARAWQSGASIFRQLKRIKRIRLIDRTIDFDYSTPTLLGRTTALLTGIREKDMVNNISQQATFSYITSSGGPETGLLRSVTTGAPGTSEVLRHTFHYFDEEVLMNDKIYQQDYWGFYNGQPNSTLLSNDMDYTTWDAQGIPYPLFNKDDLGYTLDGLSASDIGPYGEIAGCDRRPDLHYARCRTLKTVELPSGGELELEYELNTIYPQRIGASERIIPVGGLRIKSVTEKEGNGETLTTSYTYEFPVEPGSMVKRSAGRYTVLDKAGFKTPVPYSGFTDLVLSSSLSEQSCQVLNTGNNEVFYNYVEEKKPGRGKTGYKFFCFADETYTAATAFQPYWLEGLLLAQIHYDEAGQVVAIEKNQYQLSESDLPSLGGVFGSEYRLMKELFFTNSATYAFGQSNHQIKPIAAFIDPTPYENYPAPQLVFSGTREVYYNSYNYDFLPNIQPRQNNPRLYVDYEMRYGGSVLLKEQEKLVIPAVVHPSLPVLSSTPYSFLSYLQLTDSRIIRDKTTFYYDNPQHRLPTRIETAYSDGRKTMTKNKYAVEYAAASGTALDRLQHDHQGLTLIESQQWIQAAGSSTWKLLSGKVTEYTLLEKAGLAYAVPAKGYAIETAVPLIPGTDGLTADALALPPPYTPVFSGNEPLYKEQVAYSWNLWARGPSLAGVTQKGSALAEAYVNDIIRNESLAVFTHASKNEALAVDYRWLRDVYQKYGGYNARKTKISRTTSYLYNPFPGSPYEYDFPEFFHYLAGQLQALESSGEPVWQEMLSDSLVVYALRMVNAVDLKKEHHSYTEAAEQLISSYPPDVLLPTYDAMAAAAAPYLDLKSMLAFLRTTASSLRDESAYTWYIIEYPMFDYGAMADQSPFFIELTRYKQSGEKIRVMGTDLVSFTYSIEYNNGASSAAQSLGLAAAQYGIRTGYLDVRQLPDWQNARRLWVAGNAAFESLVVSPETSAFECKAIGADGRVKYVYNHLGDRIHYFYDPLGRVSYITDKKGQVLKYFCYNLKGQPEACKLYVNTEKSRTLTRNNCPSGQTGATYTYVVPSGKYVGMTQAEADARAVADLDEQAQQQANSHGACWMVYYNSALNQSFSRNNCGSGNGSSVVYEVPAGKYSSLVSQQDADAQAQAEVNAHGQPYANTNGTCPVFWNTAFDFLYHYAGCDAGQIGDFYKQSVAANTISSTISVDDANAKADAFWKAEAQQYLAAHHPQCHTRVYATLYWDDLYTDWYSGQEYGTLYVAFFTDEGLGVPANAEYMMIKTEGDMYQRSSGQLISTIAHNVLAGGEVCPLTTSIVKYDPYSDIEYVFRLIPDNDAQIYIPINP